MVFDVVRDKSKHYLNGINFDKYDIEYLLIEYNFKNIKNLWLDKKNNDVYE